MSALRFIGVSKDTTTAGPGKRLEFFTKGCIRGVVSPCDGCFNQSTWTFEGKYRGLTEEEVIEICLNDAWNRQVTFCGGEPILQGKKLSKIAKKLKEIDPSFHFVMYTSYKLDSLMRYGLNFTWVKEKHGLSMYEALLDYSSSAEVIEVNEAEAASTKVKFNILTQDEIYELMTYIDLIVDGDYQQDKRLTTEQYMHEGWFIGSSNQRVIFGPETIESCDTSIGEMRYIGAKEYNEQRQSSNHCKCCGHGIESGYFCNDICNDRYDKRKKEMALIGGV